ncbi:hypothetical protein AJ79_06068 [Helicocarpus griseus UAMH5409]|uniref:Uncharacterized protein n=1 Tax=Helicocarpus griseus UAMH5409 TaxID=1447875 RepID=A0A2B7XGN8_9EURO|nr:hypothetical protein AJ79_06068 [Helicocarpus griseus UAMH5409]
MKLLWLLGLITLCLAGSVPTGFENAELQQGPALPPRDALPLETRKSGKALSSDEVKEAAAKMSNAKGPEGAVDITSNPGANGNKCKKNQVQDKKAKGGCHKCKRGTKPVKNQKECVPKGDKDKDKDKEQGSCPKGQILDPAEGGQDKKTKKPKCVPDDDAKCPKGQSAVTRAPNEKNRMNYKPECAKDDDPDHKCKAGTYDHRVKKGNKIAHSCRSTRKAQKDKQNKYKRFFEKVKGKKKGKDKEKDKKKDKNKKKGDDKSRAKRGRAGWCWSILTAIEAPDFGPQDQKDLTQDELDGMLSMWPDKKVPAPQGNGDIPDHVVKIVGKASVSITGTDSAGFGGIFSGLGKAIARIFKKGGKKGGGKKGAGKNGEPRDVLKELKTGGRGKASSKALQKAKKSPAVQKMLKQQRYRDCLLTRARSGGTKAINKPFDGDKASVDVDWSRKKIKNKPLPKGTDGKKIQLWAGDKTDSSSKSSALSTYHDNYYRFDRLLYETCQKADDYKDLNNRITDIRVQGGCCTFYDKDKCQKKTILFSMTDRQDGQLKGKHNDAISSWWCTFDKMCKGAPGI